MGQRKCRLSVRILIKSGPRKVKPKSPIGTAKDLKTAKIQESHRKAAVSRQDKAKSTPVCEFARNSQKHKQLAYNSEKGSPSKLGSVSAKSVALRIEDVCTSGGQKHTRCDKTLERGDSISIHRNLKIISEEYANDEKCNNSATIENISSTSKESVSTKKISPRLEPMISNNHPTISKENKESLVSHNGVLSNMANSNRNINGNNDRIRPSLQILSDGEKVTPNLHIKSAPIVFLNNTEKSYFPSILHSSSSLKGSSGELVSGSCKESEESSKKIICLKEALSNGKYSTPSSLEGVSSQESSLVRHEANTKQIKSKLSISSQKEDTSGDWTEANISVSSYQFRGKELSSDTSAVLPSCDVSASLNSLPTVQTDEFSPSLIISQSSKGLVEDETHQREASAPEVMEIDDTREMSQSLKNYIKKMTKQNTSKKYTLPPREIESLYDNTLQFQETKEGVQVYLRHAELNKCVKDKDKFSSVSIYSETAVNAVGKDDSRNTSKRQRSPPHHLKQSNPQLSSKPQKGLINSRGDSESRGAAVPPNASVKSANSRARSPSLRSRERTQPLTARNTEPSGDSGRTDCNDTDKLKSAEPSRSKGQRGYQHQAVSKREVSSSRRALGKGASFPASETSENISVPSSFRRFTTSAQTPGKDSSLKNDCSSKVITTDTGQMSAQRKTMVRRKYSVESRTKPTQSNARRHMMDDIKMCVQKPEIVPRSLVRSCTRSDGTPSISSSHTSSSKQKVVRAKNDVISVADTKKHDSRGANAKLPLKTQVHDSIVQCYAISSNRKSPTTTQESPTGPLRDMSHDLEPSSNSMGLRGSTILIQGKSVSRKRASTNLQMEMFTEEPLDPDGIECASVDYTESEIFEEKIKFPLVADSIEEVDEEMEYLQPPEFSPDSTSEGGKTHTDFN